MREERARTIPVPFESIEELRLLGRMRGDVRAEGMVGMARLRREASDFYDLMQRAEDVMHEECARAIHDGWPPFLKDDEASYALTEATLPASRAFLRIANDSFPEIHLRCSIDLEIHDPDS